MTPLKRTTTSIRGARVACRCALACAVLLCLPAAARAVVPAPAWAPLAVSGPTDLPPGGEGEIAIYLQNIGGITSSASESIRVVDRLPAGIVTAASPSGKEKKWVCTPGAGQSTVECTASEYPVGPGLIPEAIIVPVSVEAAPGALENEVEASGGGAVSPASYRQRVIVSATPAKPGVAAFTAGTYNADGTPATQAGSHPYVGTSMIFANTVVSPHGNVVPAGDPKTIEVGLPPGFLGDPLATPRCQEGTPDRECPVDTQVGVVQPVTGSFSGEDEPEALHAVEAPVGYPAKYTFTVILEQINVLASLRSDEDYGVSLTSPNTPQISPVYGSIFSVWGNPASPSHDEQRCVEVGTHNFCGPGNEETALITMPSDCALEASVPPVAELTFDTWLTVGQFEHEAFPVPAVTGCEALSLQADLAVQPQAHAAATPSAFSTDLTLPQEGIIDPEALATPPLRTAIVTFPEGVTLNPAAASGLASCSLAQIGYRGNSFPEPNKIRFDKQPAQCPEASKVGTIEVKTALLEKPLHGSLYLAAEHENPFGSLLAVYMVIEDPSIGIISKLPGEIRPDPVSGRLTAVFDDAPQLAVGEVKLELEGGSRAPLATPDTCGTFTTTGRFTPWSAPESGADTISSSSFQVSEGPGGGACVTDKAARPFHPSFRAGTANTLAGAHTQLEFDVSRKDGEQEIKGLSFILPPGVTGSIATVGRCSDAQIAAAEGKTGSDEQASPSCPASSELGSIFSSAGIGPAPIHVDGKLYLAGPYQGAPLSAVAIVPAVAGPYDLGNVVLRASLHIDPITGQITADTVGVPNIMKGIPLSIRSARVLIDRPGFIQTPTSCERMRIEAKITGAGGDTASSADDTTYTAGVPFQVGGCEHLAFKPAFSVSTSGKTSRKEGASLTATVTYPNAPVGTQANIHSVKVDLPKQLPSRLTTLQKACTDKVFEVDPAQCPAASRVGTAKAITPILAVPLEGPAYFVSHGGAKFPELVVVLQGEGITIDLHGETFISKAGITSSTFHTVPDQPVSSFQITLPEGPNSALAANGDLCSLTKTVVRLRKKTIKSRGHRRTVTRKVRTTVATGLAMPTIFTGQNGAVLQQDTPITVTGCAKHKAKQRKASKATTGGHTQPHEAGKR